MLPLAVPAVEQKIEFSAVERKNLQLRRGLKTAQLYNVAAPAAGEVVKAVEDINKAKEDEEFWNRLLNYSEGSMKEPEEECRFPGFGVC